MKNWKNLLKSEIFSLFTVVIIVIAIGWTFFTADFANESSIKWFILK